MKTVLKMVLQKAFFLTLTIALITPPIGANPTEPSIGPVPAGDVRAIDDGICANINSGSMICTTDCGQIVKCNYGKAILVEDCTATNLNCYPRLFQYPVCSRISHCNGPIICTQSGQFPDPYKCTIYHDCAGFDAMSVAQHCGKGKAYNIATGKCDLPTTAAECQDEGPVPYCTPAMNKGYLPNNRRYYYVCKWEDSIAFPFLYLCDEGYVYDEGAGRCMRQGPPDAICDDTPNSYFCTADCVNKVQCVDGYATVTDCSKSGQNCYNPNSLLVPRCSRVSQCGGPIICYQAGNFPDPDNCQLYHKCSGYNFASTVHKCPESLAYNIVNNMCDLPTTSTVCQNGGPVPTCFSFLQEGTLPDNKNYYYRCLWETYEEKVLYPSIRQCKEGLIYDEGMGKCMRPKTTTTPIPTEEPATTVQAATTIRPPYVICKDLPNFSQFCTPDCTRKVDCINGNSTVTDCSASGLHCYNNSDLVMKPHCSRISLCGGPIICAESGQFPDPDNCQLYHACTGVNVSSTVHTCPKSFAYNIVTNTCDLPTTATVCQYEGPVPTCFSEKQKGTLPDNKSYYYRCQREHKVLYPALFWCGKGYIFDECMGRCIEQEITTTPIPTEEPTTTVQVATTIRPPYVICKDHPNFSQFCTPDCTSKVDCINGNSTVTDCSASGLHCYNNSDLVMKPHCSRISQCGGPIICAESGQFPDPDNCQLYHACTGVNVSSTVHKCPKRFAYNIVTNTCDLPTTATVCQYEGPVPTCFSEKQKGTLPDNKSYYYRCQREHKVLYPALFWCGKGYIFDECMGRCIEQEITTTLVPTEKPVTTTEGPPDVTCEVIPNFIHCLASCVMSCNKLT